MSIDIGCKTGWEVIVLIILHRNAYNDCEVFWTERAAGLRRKELIKDGINSYDLIIQTRTMPIEANLARSQVQAEMVREKNEEFDKYPRPGNANLPYED